MLYVTPGQSFEASAGGADSGLVGTIGVRIMDGVGGTTTARTTAGIVESPANSGIYTATLTAPAAAGQYVIAWDTGGGTPVWTIEDLVVSSSTPVLPVPPSVEPDVRARFERMVSASTDPVLSSDDVDQLLVLARRADPDGRAPSDSGWIPTYDLRAAAAEGWRWKAGMVSDRFGYSADGEKVDRQQLLEHCLEMAKTYAKGSTGVTSLRTTVGRGRLPAGLEGWEPLLPDAAGPTHDGPPYVSPYALPGAFERGDSTV